MGIKRKKQEKELAIEHMQTRFEIANYYTCRECPVRLYSKEKYITYGVGNLHSDTIFILPNYDINAKIGYKTILYLL